MLLKIHTPTFPLSNALSDHVDAKVRLALGLYRDKIRSVDVFLTDENGPKGGNDMRCKISVKADGHPLVLAQQTADDIYEAINLCAHRIKRSVGRRFDRILEHRRRTVDNRHLHQDEQHSSTV